MCVSVYSALREPGLSPLLTVRILPDIPGVRWNWASNQKQIYIKS